MKLELLKNIIASESNTSQNKDIKAYRIFCGLSIILLPAFWFVHKSTNPQVVDPLPIRILLSFLFSIVFVGSYTSGYIQKHIAVLMKAFYFIMTTWIIYLNYLNQFSEHAILLIVSSFGIMVLVLKKRNELISYASLLLGLTSLACLLNTHTKVDKVLFLSNLATVVIISYFVSTSKFKIQEENAMKKQLMTTIFDESADALFLLDPKNGEVIYCNYNASVIFGGDDINKDVGVNINILQNKFLGENNIDILGEVRKNGMLSTKIEYTDCQGRKKWGDLVIKKIQIVFEPIFLGRISDISQLKKAEEALQKVNDELERRVKERTAELLQSNVLLKQEVSERQRAEEQLIYTAFHDALTGLPNRALFIKRLEHAMEQTKRCRDYLFAVLFVDLDRFKVVNDSLGHMVGDQLLLVIASRIKTCLRSGDTFARLGGDEFTILLEDIKDISDAERVATRIQEELTLPFNLNGHEVFTSASIGIALSKIGYDRPEQLLRDADIAMYRAKARGKACYKVFDIAMHTSVKALLQLETDLRRAIERQEFRLHYQPIVSLENCKIVGFEALIRWQHPNRGLILPAEFITVAEETGLIIPIGCWVFREACRQRQLWQEKSAANPPLTISVNISGKQFSHPELSEQIEQILQETGLDPHALKLELTESVIMENAESANVMLSQLRSLGVQLYMDDFGTGYSSLSYLQRFPISGLKIDRSFINRIGTGEENREIVRTIVTLAHNLGMHVTAEGVETVEQLTFLRTLKSEYGQGYFFSKPVNSVKAEVLITAEQYL